jgi:hypothetical protein
MINRHINIISGNHKIEVVGGTPCPLSCGQSRTYLPEMVGTCLIILK